MREEAAETRPIDTTSEGDTMAGDRRLARADNSLPDWEMPDGAYRPVPIVWFMGAFLMQVIGQAIMSAIVAGILDLSATMAAAFALLLTGLIWFGTWERGMGGASLGWRVTTIAMLAITLAFTVVALFELGGS